MSWQKDILSAMNTGGVEEKEAETSGEEVCGECRAGSRRWDWAWFAAYEEGQEVMPGVWRCAMAYAVLPTVGKPILPGSPSLATV